MMRNLIDFFVAAWRLLAQSLGLAVNLLQLLQLKPYVTNIGFIKSFIG